MPLGGRWMKLFFAVVRSLGSLCHAWCPLCWWHFEAVPDSCGSCRPSLNENPVTDFKTVFYCSEKFSTNSDGIIRHIALQIRRSAENEEGLLCFCFDMPQEVTDCALLSYVMKKVSLRILFNCFLWLSLIFKLISRLVFHVTFLLWKSSTRQINCPEEQLYAPSVWHGLRYYFRIGLLPHKPKTTHLTSIENWTISYREAIVW